MFLTIRLCEFNIPFHNFTYRSVVWTTNKGYDPWWAGHFFMIINICLTVRINKLQGGKFIFFFASFTYEDIFKLQ